MKKITVTKTIYCLLFLVFLFVIGKFLRYALNDDTSSYTRVAFHEMYEQDNIDVLFLGTSHCMHSFNPALLDEKLQMNTFNAGSSSQAPDGSLLILREAAKHNKISHVYLDIFFNNSYDVHSERTQMTNAYIISDYLKPSVEKYMYLFKASGSEHYANSFIVARRYWDRIFDPKSVAETIKKKNTEEYKQYGYEYITHENSGYAGKGYIKNLPEVKDWDFFDTWGWAPTAPDTFSDDYKNDLINIIDFCKSNGIELTLVSAPTSDFCLTAVGDYDEYLKWVHSITDERGIEYYDFSLCREEFFPSSSDMFIDPVHLNDKGASVLADTFAALVKKEAAYDDVFYPSYSEKLKSLAPNVFGVSFMSEYDDSGNVVKNCRIITNTPDKLEYRISVEPKQGDPCLLRDYSTDTSFTMDPDAAGKIVIEYRRTDESNEKVMLRTLTIR